MIIRQYAIPYTYLMRKHRWFKDAYEFQIDFAENSIELNNVEIVVKFHPLMTYDLWVISYDAFGYKIPLKVKAFPFLNRFFWLYFLLEHFFLRNFNLPLTII